ncbi:MAG: SDR family NAD(P)-dependent oxidoreductase [Methanoregulaceae archaeon]|nr:SDR family NAD(P)-dependent oxidoreductase [Methanoregulaceae archaeon]
MKQIVITGASSGIGAAAARSLAHHELILVGRNAERLAQIAAETGGTAIIADLTTDVSVAAVADAVGSDATERVLINAAGIAHFGDSAEMPWEQYADQLAINLTAPLRLTHALLPWLLGGSGQLINVLSIAATHTFGGAAAYAAAKAGLLAAGRSLAAEYRTQGLRVTQVIPGATDTPIWEGGDFVPNRADMLSADAVAKCISDIVDSPATLNIDEITIMPPKGIL